MSLLNNLYDRDCYPFHLQEITNDHWSTQIWPCMVWCQHLSAWLVHLSLIIRTADQYCHPLRSGTDLLYPILLTHLWFQPWLPITLESYFKPKPGNFPFYSTHQFYQHLLSPPACPEVGGGDSLPLESAEWTEDRSWWTHIPDCHQPESGQFWEVLVQFSGKLVESSPLCPQPW